MDKLKIINQPYAVTMARYRFNMHEQRVFLRVLEALQPQMLYKKDKEDKIFNNETLQVKMSSLLPEGSKNYSFVNKALDRLTSKKINIQGTDKKGLYELSTRIILQFKSRKDGFVDIELSEDVLRYLLNNKRGFTSYILDIAFNASSPYAARLYQYIAHWRDKKSGFEKLIRASCLRDMLGIEGKYSRANAIFQKIIKPAMEDLEKRADVWFSIKEKVKEGRKIVGWIFKIHHRHGAKKAKKALPAPPPTKQKETNALMDTLMTKYRLSYPQAKKVYTKVDEQEIRKTLYDIYLLIMNKKIDNVGLYTWRTFRQKFFLDSKNT